MIIKGSFDLSREGNDCWINKSVSLIEDFGSNYILIHTKVSGWTEDDSLTKLSIHEWKQIENHYDKDVQDAVGELLDDLFKIN